MDTLIERCGGLDVHKKTVGGRCAGAWGHESARPGPRVRLIPRSHNWLRIAFGASDISRYSPESGDVRDPSPTCSISEKPSPHHSGRPPFPGRSRT
jgi:hypothetical protein